jgi:hypothetical protein
MKSTAPNLTGLGILAALNRRAEHLPKRHVYGGTVDPVTIAERRAANKAARKSRRVNRRAR